MGQNGAGLPGKLMLAGSEEVGGRSNGAILLNANWESDGLVTSADLRTEHNLHITEAGCVMGTRSEAGRKEKLQACLYFLVLPSLFVASHCLLA